MDSTAVEHADRPQDTAVEHTDRLADATAGQGQGSVTDYPVITDYSATEAAAAGSTAADADPASRLDRGADAGSSAGSGSDSGTETEAGTGTDGDAPGQSQEKQDADHPSQEVPPPVSTSPVTPLATPASTGSTAAAQAASDYDRNRALGVRVIAFVIVLCLLVTGWSLAHVGGPGSPITIGTTLPRRAGSPLPPRLSQQLPATFTIPGTSAAIPWPKAGQAAIEMEGYGPLGTSGPVNTPVPIASVAKTMTAYLVLTHHPLAAGESGPLITVDSADAAVYQTEKKQGQSLVEVHAGERISERAALDALMLASADNIAKILARWDAGGSAAFVRAMNATARALGMSHTTYTDPSGLDPATVSTAPDQVKLGQAAMRSAAFRAIVGQQSATVPVQGVVRNFNRLAGHDGVTGIKTGSTDQAGGCLLFADTVSLGGRDETVIGALLGQPLGTGDDFLGHTLSTASKLIAAAQGTLAAATVAAPGDQVASLDSGGVVKRNTPLSVAAPLVVVGKPGQTYRVSVSWQSSAPAVTVTALTEGGSVATDPGSATTDSLSVPLVRSSPRGALPVG